MNSSPSKPRRRTPEEKYLAFARRPKRAGSSSRYRGVSFRQQTQRWIAQVYWRGRRYFLGSYDREEDAAAAYNRHAARIIGELAVLNELPPPGRPTTHLCADGHTAHPGTPDSGEAT